MAEVRTTIDPSAEVSDEQLIAMLVDRARSERLQLAGEGGVLKQRAWLYQAWFGTTGSECLADAVAVHVTPAPASPTAASCPPLDPAMSVLRARLDEAGPLLRCRTIPAFRGGRTGRPARRRGRRPIHPG